MEDRSDPPSSSGSPLVSEELNPEIGLQGGSLSVLGR